jgi:chromosomal replication initiation ATPase DnaA
MSRIKKVIIDVANEYGVPKEALLGGIRRDILVTAARAKITYILRQGDKPLSYPQIGNALNLDHTSCLYLMKKMKATDGKYYDNLIAKLHEKTKKLHQKNIRNYKLLRLKKEFERGIMIEVRV